MPIGSLSLISSSIKKDAIIINGDLLTKINYRSLLDFHEEKKGLITLGVREYEYKIPYGVVEISKTKAINIVEKPSKKCFVNAGIYVLNPLAIKKIPKDTFFNITDLMELYFEKGEVYSYPIHEYWTDIGKMENFIRADKDFDTVFRK